MARIMPATQQACQVPTFPASISMQESGRSDDTQPAMAKGKNPNRQKRLAKEIRAARKYADLSRDELEPYTGIGDEQQGEYERGDYKRAPGPAYLAALARACDIPQAWLDAGFLAPEDPAMRFAESAAQEAARQLARPASTEEVQSDEDAEQANH